VKEMRAVVFGAVNKTLLAGVLAVAPLLSTLVADVVAPGQTYIQWNVAQAQVKAKNKTFEPRRLPGVSQSFAKDLTEVSGFLQPDPEVDPNAKPNPDKALEVLNRAARGIAKLNPYEVAQLYLYTAYAYYGKEDMRRARENFEKVLAQSPNIPVTLESSTIKTLAQLYAQEENYKKALELMVRWTDYVAEVRPDELYLFASLYYQQGDVNNALLNINEAVRVQEAANKVPAESWYGLQRGLYVEKEDFKSGVAVMEKLVRHYPKASYWRQLSQFYAQLDRGPEKLASLETTYLMGGLTVERDLIVLAQYFLEAEAPYKAAKVLDKGINKDKIIEPTAKNLELLANSWRAAADYKKSLVEMEKAAQKSENGDLLHTLATLYNSNDRYKDAVRVGNQALRKGGVKRPDQVHLAVGNAHLELGEFDAAIKSFREAAKDSRSAKIAEQWAAYATREKQRIQAVAG
jgi:tetratricopeptide (TPR) repeat protein